MLLKPFGVGVVVGGVTEGCSGANVTLRNLFWLGISTSQMKQNNEMYLLRRRGYNGLHDGRVRTLVPLRRLLHR